MPPLHTLSTRRARQAGPLALIAIAVAACAPRTTTHAAAPAMPAASPMLRRMADDVLVRTDQARRADGEPALTRSAGLMSAAQLQADQMASAGTMAHVLHGAPYPTLDARLSAVAYEVRAAGENVAEGYRDAASAVAGWMTSEGHRANILSLRYSEVGAGVARGTDGRLYFAEVFGRPLLPSTSTASR